MMKKNMIAAGTAAGAAIMIGALTLTGVFPAFAADITADKAKEIAMSHAGVEEKDVAHIRAKKDYENGQQVYEVEFYTSDYKEYDYEIAAADGAIIAYDYDAEYWQNDVSQGGEAVDLEGAKAAALADAGLKAEDVTFFKTESDWDDGRQIYEIEFYTSDGTEYDYEINAAGGQVISCDFDAEHNGKRTQAGQQNGQRRPAGETPQERPALRQMRLPRMRRKPLPWNRPALGKARYPGSVFTVTGMTAARFMREALSPGRRSMNLRSALLTAGSWSGTVRAFTIDWNDLRLRE